MGSSESRVKLAQNLVIFSQLYSIPLHSPFLLPNPNGPLSISRANNSLTTNLYVRLLFICIILVVILVSLFSFYYKQFNTCVIIPTIPTLQLNILLKSHENNMLENICLFHFGHFHTMRW